MSTKRWLDMGGNEVKVGDYIAYAVLLGHSAGLSYGRVLAIDNKGLRVLGVQPGWSGKGYYGKAPGTLKFPERTLRVSGIDIPPAAMNLLDADVESR